MSDKEIAMELLKALITGTANVVKSDNIETDRNIALGIASNLSDMYEIIYNKVHNLKD